MSYQIQTLCQIAHAKHKDPYGALNPPIYQSATFAHPGPRESTGFDYSRMQNPTREELEALVCALEGGTDAVAFSSGMAAITAVMELFSSGDHIIAEEDLYGGSTRLFSAINEKNGLTFARVNFSEEPFEAHITKATKAVYIETPTNPMMRVTDIRKTAEIAHAHGLKLIVDNTFLTPFFQNPIALGADLVIHSASKYLGGHNDTIAGVVVTASDALSERLRYIAKTTGAGLSAFDSFLIVRGIRTLPLRMEAATAGAGILAERLAAHAHVTGVLYPGLSSHPGHELLKQQSRGAGAMIAFETDTEERAEEVLRRVRLIRFAESLGGTQTLITYPITQTHADMTPAALAKCGITRRLLRLSVGVEHTEDLWNDLEQALR